jgi:hypothetical protein
MNLKIDIESDGPELMAVELDRVACRERVFVMALKDAS